MGEVLKRGRGEAGARARPDGWTRDRPLLPHNAQPPCPTTCSGMTGGGLLDGSPRFSMESGRCIRTPPPGISSTHRLIYATITAQRRLTDNNFSHRMRDRALPFSGWGATPRRISESAPFGPETGSQRRGARRTHLFTCLYIQLAALMLNDATDKNCGLKTLSTTYTFVNAEGRLVLH